MNYMKEVVDAWFDRELDRYVKTGGSDAFKKAVKDKILESYRNGQHSRRSERQIESSPKEK